MNDLQRAIDLLTALTVRKLAETVENPVTAPVSYVVRDVIDAPFPKHSVEWKLDLGSGVIVPLHSEGQTLNKHTTEHMVALADDFVSAAEACWHHRQALINEFCETRDLVAREIKSRLPGSWGFRLRTEIRERVQRARPGA